jgi:hypothetical protein
LAQAKGKGGLSWWLISLFPGPIATFLILVLDPIKTRRLMTRAERYEGEHGQQMLAPSSPFNKWLAAQQARLEAIESERATTQARRWEADHGQEHFDGFEPIDTGQEAGLETSQTPTQSAHVRNLGRQGGEAQAEADLPMGWAAFNSDGNLLRSTISPFERETKEGLHLVTRPAQGLLLLAKRFGMRLVAHRRR